MAVRSSLGLVAALLAAVVVACGAWWLLDSADDLGGGQLAGDDPLDAASPTRVPQLSASGRPAERSAHPASSGNDGAAAREVPEAPAQAPGRIVGVVTDADGRPIRGARVMFIEPTTQAARRGKWTAPSSTMTDENGQFVYDTSKDGFYQVRVVADGYVGTGVNGMGGAAPLRVELSRAMTLQGVLTEEGTGAPIANLGIWAAPVKSGEMGRRVAGQTDEGGRFSFEVPEGESHFIQFPSAMYALGGVSGEWIHTRWGPFDRRREDLALELERGRVIAGIVRDASGAPLVEVFRVEVLGRTSRGDLDYDRRRFAQTDSSGAFKTTGLPDGRYLVTVKPLGVVVGNAAPSALTERSIDGVAAGTEDLVIELSRGEPMVGRIVDDAGEPVTTKGYVHIYPQGSTAGSPDSIHGALDGKGGFKSTPLDTGTTYDLLVSGFEGYRWTKLKGVRSGVAVVQVILESAGIIKGRVVRADGGPLPVGLGVLATAVGASTGEKGGFGFTYTKPDGSFTLNGLGEFSFRVAAGGAGSGFVSAGLAEDIRPGATEVVIRVKRGVALSGKLLDTHGDPVKSHLLTAISLDAPQTPSASTSIKGDDGVFHFAGVSEGKLRILAYLGGTQVVVGVLTAPAMDVVLRLPED